MGSSLRIAIIGSGAAAVGALSAIDISCPDANVTLFDIGEKLLDPPILADKEPKTIQAFYDQVYSTLKQYLGLRFPPIKTHFGQHINREIIEGKKRFFRSYLLGGLTNVWGATLIPFHERDLAGWPISEHDLKPHYQAIADLVGISGQRDGLNRHYTEEYSNRPPIHLLRGIERLNRTVNSTPAEGEFDIFSGINRAGVETRRDLPRTCTYCGECMAGCFCDSIYSARKDIESHIQNQKITYIQGKVLTIDPHTRVIHLQSGQERTCHSGFNRIFLCAGCAGSTEILLRSLGIKSGPILYDNAIFQFPILNLGSSDSHKNKYLSLSNLIVACISRDLRLHDAHVQIYPNFDYLWRSAVPEFLWPAVKWPISLLRDRLIWARLYLHSDHSYAYQATLNDHDELTFIEIQNPNKEFIQPVLKSLKSVVNRDGFFIPPVPPIMAKTSSHLAGTFPYDGPIVNLKSNGEVMSNVFICDSTCFPNSPAASPTFTIMANSSRTVTEALD